MTQSLKIVFVELREKRFAAPEIWTRFADFYKRSADAAKSAFDASRAQTPAEFKKYAIELRAGCDGCHALYQKKD